MSEETAQAIVGFIFLTYVALVAVAPFALVGSIVAIAIAMWTS